ncbi:site-2 protease family protein [Candidatus Woesearchaeota archaeon]|nr:site-2 protease family protein [Candidatus Woesearchaeota archaeon]
MSFILALLEYKVTLIFYFLVFLFVYLNRKKFDIHGKFIFLYRTKIGIKFMGIVAKRATKIVKAIGHIAAATGFLGMIFTFIFILFSAYGMLIDSSKTNGASPVIPGLPIAGTGLVFPLLTGWIVLFIIIAVHEFSHGIVASAHNIKVKNSGMAFFGPILGAFVEPDEKKLSKEKSWIQYSVFAAGPFSNFLSFVIAVLIVSFLLNPALSSLSVSKGAIIYSQPGLPADKAGILNDTVVTAINGKSVSTIKDFQEIMKDIGPNKKIEIKSNDKSYIVTTTENPDEHSKGYLGVWVTGEKSELKHSTFFNEILFSMLKWSKQLLGWLAFLSLNIGLINLLPVFVTDGARMLKVFFEKIIQDKQRSISAWLFVNWMALGSLLILIFLPLFRLINLF